MKTFMITYTLDRGLTKHSELVCAEDYTKAYLDVYLRISIDAIILDLFEVK